MTQEKQPCCGNCFGQDLNDTRTTVPPFICKRPNCSCHMSASKVVHIIVHIEPILAPKLRPTTDIVNNIAENFPTTDTTEKHCNCLNNPQFGLPQHAPDCPKVAPTTDTSDQEKQPFCRPASKPCRTKEEAEAKASSYAEYRRAYQCEFCDYWHVTSRLRHEDVILKEPQELDYD